jgi:hypothetical protein
MPAESMVGRVNTRRVSELIFWAIGIEQVTSLAQAAEEGV